VIRSGIGSLFVCSSGSLILTPSFLTPFFSDSLPFGLLSGFFSLGFSLGFSIGFFIFLSSEGDEGGLSSLIMFEYFYPT